MRGGHQRLHHHQVGQLPVGELLERERPQRAQRLAVQPQRAPGARGLQRQERQPDRQRGRGVRHERAVEHVHVHHRRQQRQQQVEQQQVQQPQPPHAALLAHRDPVLPHGLERAVGPPVALPVQRPQPRRDLGPRPRARLVHHPPARAGDRHGHVGVLGERVRADPADLHQRLPAERADRAGDRGQAAPGVEDLPVQVRARGVLQVLPAAEQPAPVGDLDVAGHRADAGRGQRGDERGQRARLEDRVAVDQDERVVPGQRHPGVERLRLAAVLPRDHPDAGQLQRAHHVGGAVRGAVVDHDHLDRGRVVRGHQRADGGGDGDGLVVGGHHHRHRRQRSGRRVGQLAVQPARGVREAELHEHPQHRQRRDRADDHVQQQHQQVAVALRPGQGVRGGQLDPVGGRVRRRSPDRLGAGGEPVVRQQPPQLLDRAGRAAGVVQPQHRARPVRGRARLRDRLHVLHLQVRRPGVPLGQPAAHARRRDQRAPRERPVQQAQLTRPERLDPDLVALRDHAQHQVRVLVDPRPDQVERRLRARAGQRVQQPGRPARVRPAVHHERERALGDRWVGDPDRRVPVRGQRDGVGVEAQRPRQQRQQHPQRDPVRLHPPLHNCPRTVVASSAATTTSPSASAEPATRISPVRHPVRSTKTLPSTTTPQPARSGSTRPAGPRPPPPRPVGRRGPARRRRAR